MKKIVTLAMLLLVVVVANAQYAPFQIAFAIWQDPANPSVQSHYPETVAPTANLSGGPGTIWEGDLGAPGTGGWYEVVPDEFVDFTRANAFNRIGVVLFNPDPFCIPMGLDWSASGCPELAPNFFPMVARITVTARATNGVTKTVFDQTVTWEWPQPQSYGGYGFYWWHRVISGYSIENYGQMPIDNWRSPNDFYNGNFHMRFEIISQPGSGVVVPPPLTVPSYTIDYANERTLQIVPSTDQYSFDNVNFTNGANTYVSITPGQTAYFRRLADYSKKQTLTVPGRPAAPAFGIDYPNERTSSAVSTEYNFSSSSNMSGAIQGSGAAVAITPGSNMYFQKRAVSGTAFRSSIQNLTVAARPAGPGIGIDYVYERTASVVASDIDYSSNSNMSGSQSGIGSYLSLVPGNTLYFQKKSTSSSFKSVIEPLNVPARPASTTYAVNFIDETTSSALNSNINYSQNADMSEALAGAGAVIPVTPGTNLYIQKTATQSQFSSLIQTLVVESRPALPDFSIDFIDEKTAMPVTSEFMHASNADMSDATAGSGQNIPVPPLTTLYFQKSASATNFSSEVQTLVAPDRPQETSMAIDFVGEKLSTPLDASIEYSLTPDMSSPIQGEGEKIALTPGQDLYLRIKASLTGYASQIQYIDVPNRPQLGSTVSGSTDLNPFEVKVYFFQMGIELSESGLSVTNGNVNNLALVSSESNLTVYTADISASSKDLVSVSVAANATQDGNFESESFEVNYTGEETGIELSSSLQFQIYPNPSEGLFYLKGEFGEEPVRIDIYAITGKQVYSNKIVIAEGETIDLSDAPKGVYMIHLTSQANTAIRKVVVQ